MDILTVAEMKSVEKKANDAGISYETMMQHAGSGVAEWITRNLDTTKSVIGLVGSGNNGGDTLIALTELSKRGIRTNAFLTRPRESDPLIDGYQKTGGSVINLSDNKNLNLLLAALLPGSILLDGILGTGFKLPLRGELAEVMQSIASILDRKTKIITVAVDCPSGVDCDTGEVADHTLKAVHTLTMAAVKQGLLQLPARSYCGEFHRVDIGIGEISNYLDIRLPVMIDPDWVKDRLPDRPEDGHKGTFGTCLIIAGSESYTGAAFLTGKSAYRSGCGLVNMATFNSVRKCLAGELVESVWTVLPKKSNGYSIRGIDILKPHFTSSDSLVIGPGWGVNATNLEFLSALLEVLPKDLPTLIDADGLKLLSQIDHWWERIPTRTILTPHPGEMSVLTGLPVSEIQSDRWNITRRYATEWGVTLLLKGAVTVLANPEGDLFINPISDNALATAGSGDVLSGMIGGLLAQGMDFSLAAASGAWLHGTAGQCAKTGLGTSISVTALDILESIPRSFVKLKEVG